MKRLSSFGLDVRRLSRLGLILLPVLVGLAFLPACSGNGAKGNATTQAAAFVPTVPVTIGAVTQETIPVEVRVIGNVEAYSTVTVKAQIDGEVNRVYFQEGQDVKAGDLLFTIDSRPFEARLKQAEATQARDAVQTRNAQAQADRYAKLFQAGIASKDQFDQFQTNADALEAAVRADKAALDNAKLDLGYCTVRSPIDGRTGSLMVHPGNIVKGNDTSLVVINQVTPAYVDFSVPEQYLAEVKRYRARGNLRVRAIIPQDEQRPADGVLSFVNNSVDATTGTILLKGTFANPDRRLWPGQFVNVVLTLTSRPNAVVVPSQAVQTGQAGHYVFLVKPDFTVSMVPVVAGGTFGGVTVIEKGLEPGGKVVTDGQLMLFPGAKVQVKNP